MSASAWYGMRIAYNIDYHDYLSQMDCAWARLWTCVPLQTLSLGKQPWLPSSKNHWSLWMQLSIIHTNLGHTTDPVPGRSVSPIGILALSHSCTIVFPLPSLFPAPLHRPGNYYGISKFSCKTATSSCSKFCRHPICKGRSVALILTRCFWLLLIWCE